MPTRFVAPRRGADAVLAAVVLAGCAGMLPGGGAPPQLYTLSPKSTFAADLEVITWQLVVEVPIAAGGLTTPRIALKTKPIELQYFASARFTESAPEMVQTLLVESFENTGKIVAVGRQAIGLRSDYNLKSELREFQAEYFGGVEIPTVRVRINAKLIKQPQRVIIASQNFEQRVKAAGPKMAEVVAAFDEALGKVLKGVVEWTLRSAR